MVRVQLEDIAEVWRRSPVSAVPPQDLMLVTDFDGTLADIGPDPARSAAQPEALDALRRLSRLLKQVVVLSSRTPTDLERLVPVKGPRHADYRQLSAFPIFRPATCCETRCGGRITAASVLTAKIRLQWSAR